MNYKCCVFEHICLILLLFTYQLDNLIMITDISLIKSPYYPYHLTWEELNNPGSVMQDFIQKWDLQHSRILLKKWQAGVAENSLLRDEEGYQELKNFLSDLEKLIEAVFVLRFQQDIAR